MKNTRSLSVALALTTLVVPASATAAPLQPQRPSDVVTLRSSGAQCAAASFSRLFDTRVLPNGTTVPFSLPPGRVLVITGIDWTVEGAPLDAQIELLLYVEGTGPLAPVLADRGDASGAQILRSTTVSPIVTRGPVCAVSNTSVDFVGGVVHGFLARDE